MLLLIKAKQIALCLFILFTCAAAVLAQGAVGSTRGLPDTSGGSNTVQGHLYFPEGDPGGKRLRITIESNDDTSKTTQSDGDGTFLFNSLKSGSYTIVVDGGKEYDNARETIFFEGSRRNVVVPITMKVKGATAAAFAGVPKSAVDLYKKGQESAQKGDSKKAVEQLTAALAQAPNFTLALNELGTQYMKLGRNEEARQTFETVLKSNDRDSTAHVNLGMALYTLSLALLADKKTDEAAQKLALAEQQFRDAIRLNPKGPSGHYYLGLTLFKLRNQSEAQTEFEAAIANGYDNLALAHRYLGGLYMNAKRNKDAADQLEKYLQIDPRAKDADRIRETIKDLRSKQ